jgi:hypothetical protein
MFFEGVLDRHSILNFLFHLVIGRDQSRQELKDLLKIALRNHNNTSLGITEDIVTRGNSNSGDGNGNVDSMGLGVSASADSGSSSGPYLLE